MAENGDNVAALVELAQDTGKLEAQAETAKQETEELKQELADVKQKITWGEDELRWLDQWVSGRLEEINRRLDALENGEELDNLIIQSENQAETEATVIEAKPVETAVEKKTQKKLRWGLI